MKRMIVIGIMAMIVFAPVIVLGLEVLNPSTVKVREGNWDPRLDPDGSNTAYRQVLLIYPWLDDETAFKYSRFGQVLPYMFKDWQQTREIKNHPNMYEMNPALGKHPSDAKIDGYFALSTILLFRLVAKLSEPWASSVADSIAYTERLVTEQNQDVYSKKQTGKSIPFGVVFTVRF